MEERVFYRPKGITYIAIFSIAIGFSYILGLTLLSNALKTVPDPTNIVLIAGYLIAAISLLRNYSIGWYVAIFLAIFSIAIGGIWLAIGEAHIAITALEIVLSITILILMLRRETRDYFGKG